MTVTTTIAGKGCAPRILRPEAEAALSAEPLYTIASLVTNREHYTAMLASFRAGGFEDSRCEYIFVDNTGELQTDAYRGLNALLNAARAPIVILCHQDVRLLSDGRKSLDQRLADAQCQAPCCDAAGIASERPVRIAAFEFSEPLIEGFASVAQ